jgi:hypothetical protein
MILKRKPKAAIVMAVLLLLAGLFSSCGQPEAATPVPSAPAPAPTVSGGSFSIAQFFPRDYLEDEGNRDHFGYLQKLLRDNGWKIELRAEPAVNNAAGDLLVIQSIRQDVASGAVADGYVVSADDAQVLLNTGFARDLADLVPRVAPELYGRYSDLFAGRVAGLPLALRRFTNGYLRVLYLRKDRALAGNARIRTVEDMLALLEGDAAARIGVLYDFSRSGILDAWAGEQGYYPLELYGIHGAFYAAAGDAQCEPVPVEGIPGFAEFFDRCFRLVSSGRLVPLWYGEMPVAEGVIGVLRPLSPTVIGSAYSGYQAVGNDYIALPLEGCGIPALPQDQPAVSSEMAVHAGSGSAEQVIGFVQWALMSREGYDLVNYGKDGVDYRLYGGRLEFLNGGSPLTAQDWKGPISSAAYAFKGSSFISDETMGRVTVYAPENYEAVMQGMLPATHPIWSVQRFRNEPYQCYLMFSDISDANVELVSDRYQLLNGIKPRGSGDDFYENGADCRAALSLLADDTQKLAEAYRDRIRQMMREQGE